MTAINTTMNAATTIQAATGELVTFCSAYATAETVNATIDQTSNTGGRLRMIACPDRPNALFRALWRYVNWRSDRG